ncbi:MAG: hypothetical protein HY721_11025 [Planctomycetes bacterium]|nr:hypothetical protein [Planctomycetota bacterium]
MKRVLSAFASCAALSSAAIVPSAALGQAELLRGDYDQSGDVSVGDALALIAPLTLWGSLQPCEAAGDADGDGKLGLTDVVRILSFLFLGAPAPPPPFPEPGPSPGDPLPCEAYAVKPAPEDSRVRLEVTDTGSATRSEPLVFPAAVYLSLQGTEPREVATGWSFGLTLEGCQVIEATIEGTGAESIMSGGFSKTEIVPAPGGNGVVSAVILSFTGPRGAGNGTDLLALKWVPVFPGPKKVVLTCNLQFTEKLRGSGQPVKNRVTLGSREVVPKLEPQMVYGYPPPRFEPGDCNEDYLTDISDAIFILSFLFLGGRQPDFFAPCDTDGNGQIQITDSVRLLNYLFLGGPPPVLVF